MSNEAEKISKIGCTNGQPAIEYWRYGNAALGEPHIVTRVQEFPDVASRDAAINCPIDEDESKAIATPARKTPSSMGL